MLSHQHNFDSSDLHFLNDEYVEPLNKCLSTGNSTSTSTSCSLVSSGVFKMAGELSGVLDNGDPTESSLDERLEIEHAVQGAESIGTATVSGACGGLAVKV